MAELQIHNQNGKISSELHEIFTRARSDPRPVRLFRKKSDQCEQAEFCGCSILNSAVFCRIQAPLKTKTSDSSLEGPSIRTGRKNPTCANQTALRKEPGLIWFQNSRIISVFGTRSGNGISKFVPVRPHTSHTP